MSTENPYTCVMHVLSRNEDSRQNDGILIKKSQFAFCTTFYVQQNFLHIWLKNKTNTKPKACSHIWLYMMGPTCREIRYTNVTKSS